MADFAITVVCSDGATDVFDTTMRLLLAALRRVTTVSSPLLSLIRIIHWSAAPSSLPVPMARLPGIYVEKKRASYVEAAGIAMLHRFIYEWAPPGNDKAEPIFLDLHQLCENGGIDITAPGDVRSILTHPIFIDTHYTETARLESILAIVTSKKNPRRQRARGDGGGIAAMLNYTRSDEDYIKQGDEKERVEDVWGTERKSEEKEGIRDGRGTRGRRRRSSKTDTKSSRAGNVKQERQSKVVRTKRGSRGSRSRRERRSSVSSSTTKRDRTTRASSGDDSVMGRKRSASVWSTSQML